jgi:hypothetical protein
VLDQLLDSSHEHLSNYSPAQLASTIWAAARLGYRPSRSWLKAYLAAATQLLPSFRAHELANVLWALGSLRFHPGRRLMQQFLVAAGPQLSAANAAELLQILGAMTKLSSYSVAGSVCWCGRISDDASSCCRNLPAAWCTTCTSSLQQQLPAMQPAELAALLWMLSHLQHDCRLRSAAVECGLVGAAQAEMPGLLQKLSAGEMMMALSGLAGEPGGTATIICWVLHQQLNQF